MPIRFCKMLNEKMAPKGKKINAPWPNPAQFLDPLLLASQIEILCMQKQFHTHTHNQSQY